MINLKINDSLQTFKGPITLKQVLKSLDLEGKPVVIEHNKNAVLPRNYDSISLSDGDSIEIITIAAGG